MCVNRIAEILKDRGMVNVRPTDELLQQWDITLHIWNKWVRKKSDPELGDIEEIAIFLGCSINELIERKNVAA